MEKTHSSSVANALGLHSTFYTNDPKVAYKLVRKLPSATQSGTEEKLLKQPSFQSHVQDRMHRPCSCVVCAL